MLESIFNDVSAVFSATFLTGEWSALAVALGSVLVAVAIMRRGTQIGSMTLLALVLFAAGCIVRGFMIARDNAAGGVPPSFTSRLEASYLEFANLEAGTILAYFIAFMVALLVLFAIKSLIAR